MSRFIDKLKKLSQTAPSPMGFRTSKPAEKISPLLIIGRTLLKTTASAAKSSSGADALLVHTDKSELTALNAQKTAKAFDDIPWGVYLDESDDTAAVLAEAGCDFVVFSPTARIAELPQDEKTGRIVQVDSSMDDGLLRAINDLPADAVLVTDTLEGNETLTLHQLMIYRHLANFIAKPLIVPIAANITEAELKALEDAEIDGVMAEMDEDSLKELRKTVNKLPPRSAKKRDKAGVTLPRTTGESAPLAPPDEEEEEE